jgi:virginiamycin B lyase
MLAGAVPDVASASLSPRLYWAVGYGSSIGRASLDGSAVNTGFVTGATEPYGVAVDDQYVYWANYSVGTIGRANLDGSSADQTFITGATHPIGLAVDADHIYWTNQTSGTIGRANLDGTNVDESFITGASFPLSVTIDSRNIYWGNLGGGGTIGRASLDGTGVDQSFITGTSVPYGMAVDGRYLYWSDNGTNTIGRANLDGSGVDQSFISGAGSPIGVAVDGQYIYWGNYGATTIGRANLDGSGVDEGFISGVGNPIGLALQAVPDAPTDVSATAGIEQATVTFATPTANGSAVSSYTVTADPGGQTATGSTSPITVAGLAADTAYTFTVTAGNGVGAGAASAASDSVAPTGPPDAAQWRPTPASANSAANGSSTTVLTVQARDAGGLDVAGGGATVTITKTSGLGSIGSVTDDGDGTYTATVTAPSSPGIGTFVATLAGDHVESGMGTQTLATVHFFPQPAIASFTPSSGGAHSTVTLTGTNLTGATHVKLNGTSAAFAVVSDTELTFTVPDGATSGTITVANPGATVTSAGAFTVAARPAITGFTPGTGPVGTPVTITGTNLGGTVGVLIGHVITVATAVSPTEVTFSVPPGAVSGVVEVLTTSGSATSAATFTVTG